MIVLFNKPFNCLSQFTDTSDLSHNRDTLSKFIDIPNIYPAGRLDRDSEGLLLLTDNGKLQSHLSNPKFKIKKTYLAQIDGHITKKAIEHLKKGVSLKDGITHPAKVRFINEPHWIWKRTPPIRYRALIPTSWIEITIFEGRNRQIRRMTAHVGFPTLRLIRVSIGDYHLKNLKPSDYIRIENEHFFHSPH